MFLMLSLALAADVNVEINAGAWSESIVSPAGEPFTRTWGPFEEGKLKVAYEITWPPTAHSVVDNGYPLDITICRVWAKGKKKDRDCVSAKIVATPESAESGAVEGSVKMSSKWDYRVNAVATGNIPSTEMPMEPRVVE